MKKMKLGLSALLLTSFAISTLAHAQARHGSSLIQMDLDPTYVTRQIQINQDHYNDESPEQGQITTQNRNFLAQQIAQDVQTIDRLTYTLADVEDTQGRLKGLGALYDEATSISNEAQKGLPTVQVLKMAKIRTNFLVQQAKQIVK